MKYFLMIMFAAILFSCNENKKEEIDHKHAAADTMMKSSVAKEDLYKDVKFTSRYDLSCGMPISAGVSDTAHYKKGVYGFCSPECKADFKQNAEKLIAAANKK